MLYSNWLAKLNLNLNLYIFYNLHIFSIPYFIVWIFSLHYYICAKRNTIISNKNVLHQRRKSFFKTTIFKTCLFFTEKYFILLEDTRKILECIYMTRSESGASHFTISAWYAVKRWKRNKTMCPLFVQLRIRFPIKLWT